jgi:hypothetical protein
MRRLALLAITALLAIAGCAGSPAGSPAGPGCYHTGPGWAGYAEVPAYTFVRVRDARVCSRPATVTVYPVFSPPGDGFTVPAAGFSFSKAKPADAP